MVSTYALAHFKDSFFLLTSSDGTEIDWLLTLVIIRRMQKVFQWLSLSNWHIKRNGGKLSSREGEKSARLNDLQSRHAKQRNHVCYSVQWATVPKRSRLFPTLLLFFLRHRSEYFFKSFSPMDFALFPFYEASRQQKDFPNQRSKTIKNRQK